MKIIFDDGNVQLRLSYDEIVPILHVDIVEFSKDLYKKYLVEFIKVLRDNNLSTVYSVCSTEKAKKFNELFGFKYLCTIEGKDIMEYTDDWC